MHRGGRARIARRALPDGENTQSAGTTIQAAEIIGRNVLKENGDPGLTFTYFKPDGTSAGLDADGNVIGIEIVGQREFSIRELIKLIPVQTSASILDRTRYIWTEYGMMFQFIRRVILSVAFIAMPNLASAADKALPQYDRTTGKTTLPNGWLDQTNRRNLPGQLKRLYQMTTGGPKVRRALYEALGNYPSSRVVTEVRARFGKEESYFAEAEGLRTLGRMKDPAP